MLKKIANIKLKHILIYLLSLFAVSVIAALLWDVFPYWVTEVLGESVGILFFTGVFYLSFSFLMKNRRLIARLTVLKNKIFWKFILFLLLLYFSVAGFVQYVVYPYDKPSTEQKAALESIRSLDDFNSNTMITSSSINKLTYIQPMNVLIRSERPINDILGELGWSETNTFSSVDMNLVTLLNSLLKGQTPVSDAYFIGNPQDSAFERSANFTSREHLRVWDLLLEGEKHYLVAISDDDSVAFKIHNDFWILSHDLVPAVDDTRDRFVEELTNYYKVSSMLLPIGFAVDYYLFDEEYYDFYSDGNIAYLAIE